MLWFSTGSCMRKIRGIIISIFMAIENNLLSNIKKSSSAFDEGLGADLRRTTELSTIV